MKNIYQTAVITKIENETTKIKNFTLNISLKAKPGQYIMVWIPGINEKPFSIANDTPLTLSIAKVGLFTEKLHQLKKGDQLTFRGPYGKSFKRKSGQILLAGGGYGIVPLYFLADSISEKRRKLITVVIGAKTKSDLAFIKKFRKLGCQVKIATDDGTAGFKGFVPQLVEKIITENKLNALYTCGPEIMMKKIAEICKKKKIFCQVSLERFFKCGGFGICGECSINGKMVCKDGPVFNGNVLA